MTFRALRLFFALLVAFSGMAHADVAPDPTLHLYMYCPFNLNICQVSPYEQHPGNPASGHADFGAINLPWSFTFVTGEPLSWSCDQRCNNYHATFGVGGTFTVEGPQGLNFNGSITGGTAWQNLDLSWGADLFFSGEWNDGPSGYGEILDLVTDQYGPYASLDLYTVPEPAILALLGTGAIIAWGAGLRRKR